MIFQDKFQPRDEFPFAAIDHNTVRKVSDDSHKSRLVLQAGADEGFEHGIWAPLVGLVTVDDLVDGREQGLPVVGPGSGGQVEAEAHGKLSCRSRVVLGTAFHGVVLHDHVPRVI